MKKNEAGSTTGRLVDQQIRAIRSALGWSCFFALLLLVYAFIYLNAANYTGYGNIFTFWQYVEISLRFEPGDSSFLPKLLYIMSTNGSVPRVVDASLEFYCAILALFTLGLFNSFVVLIARIFSKYRIKKQLKPLYNMAETALKLSEETNINKAQSGVYSENKIHDLESAIDRLSPDKPNAALHTGDSDLRGIEEAINSLIERTRASYSQQIRFVSDASHELRTPIAVMKGYTDMLDRWGKDDEKILEESIAALKAETEHMNTLVEQLLFLARGDSGRQRLEMASFSLSDMMREVYDESVMIDSGHKWEIAASGEVSAYGDIAMLKQAVRILVDNATKYTPEGQMITLKANYDDRGQPTIVVQDNGMGIPDEALSHIFERFYRSDPARNSRQGGTGLGLSIAKWIVDRHSGYLDVVSREEFGTRISIHLPKVKNTTGI